MCPWSFFLFEYVAFFLCSKDDDDDDDEDTLILNVRCHYSQAEVDKCVFNLGDCAYVKASCPSFPSNICL